jgi:superfamily II DNA or RNA helicase
VTFFFLGDIIHAVAVDEMQAQGVILSARVHARETSWDYPYCDEYSAMVSAMTQDHERNALIVGDVVDKVRAGVRPCLLVSDRKNHVLELAESLTSHGLTVGALRGGLSPKTRAQTVTEVQAGMIDVLTGTTSLLSEGFDSPGLQALFLCTPIKWSGRLTQTLGRVLRVAPGKKAPVVYDFVDAPGVLRASWNTRRRAYHAAGCQIAEADMARQEAAPPGSGESCREDLKKRFRDGAGGRGIPAR